MKTRAAVVTGPRQVEMRELPVPEIDENSGLVHVETTGVCGVDWPAFNGSWMERFKPPIILGHEIVGRIARIGAKAAERWNVKEGDRVVMEEYAPCGRCDFCLSGHYYLCGGLRMEKMYGFTSLDVAPGLWGGLANTCISIRRRSFTSCPTACRPRSRRLSGVVERDSLGAGRRRDRDRRYGRDPRPRPARPGLRDRRQGSRRRLHHRDRTGADGKKMEIARELGAHHTIDIDNEDDVVKRVYGLTGGKMADAVINVTASAPAAAQQAVELVKMRGVIVMAGSAGKAAEGFYPDMLTRKEITMKGCAVAPPVT